MRTVDVEIWRHPSVRFSNSKADRIFADASKRLQRKDGMRDVPVDIQFVRKGNVNVLPNNVPGVMRSRSDYNEVFNIARTSLKLVRGIQSCGTHTGTFAGCAPVGVNRLDMTIKGTSRSLDIILPHEFGHNCGLPDRRDNSQFIMFGAVRSGMKFVDQREASKYLNGPLETLEGELPEVTSEVPDSARRIDDFVFTEYIHGIPFEEASQYGEEEARYLEELLKDPRNEEFFTQIVTTLCYIGDPASRDAIVNFIKNTAFNTDDAFEAKLAAILHLGDFIQQTDDGNAFDFLKTLATEDSAEKDLAIAQSNAVESVEEEGVVAPDTNEIMEDLTASAALGLGLVATPAANDALETLGRSSSSSETLREVSKSAKETAEKISTEGWEGYRKN